MKTSTPLVSILMPSYNHARYVQEAIESVWRQSYKNIELIVVDDGSSDGSKELIESLLKNAPISMVFIRSENKGIVNALNTALKNSRGEFIGLLASDDRYISNKIEMHIQQLLSDASIVLSHADVSVIDTNGNVSNFDVSSRGIPAEGECGLDVLLGNSYIRFSPVLRSSTLHRLGGFDCKYEIEDWPLYLKMAHEGKIGYIRNKLTERRVHATNWSSSLARKLDVNFENAALDLIKLYSPNNIICQKASVRHMLSHVKVSIYQGSIRNGFILSCAILDKYPEARLSVIAGFLSGMASLTYGRYIKSIMPKRLQMTFSNTKYFLQKITTRTSRIGGESHE